MEIGCGAGLTTIELAHRGYVVDAIDASEAMVERTLRGVIESDVGDRVKVFRGDANSLPFEDDRFDLVLAIGVIPWLESPDRAVREMARVAKPGGYVMLSSDNTMRLNHLLNPGRNPALAPLRRILKRSLEKARLREPRIDRELVRRQTTSYIDRLILENRLETTTAITLGFGPFRFLGRRLLPESVGIRVHHWLQAFADRGVVGLRSTGSQYLVFARKPRNL